MSNSSVLFFSILAATIPAILYIFIIYWVDRYEKEPWGLLTAAFLWGAIPSIFVALFFNIALSGIIYALVGEGSTGDAIAASLIAPPVEESIKGLALLGILFWWRHEIDSLLDGIIYGAMVGMGFALVENVFYFLSEFEAGGLEAWGINVFIRTILFGLNHSLFTSMIGLGIAYSRMSTHVVAQVIAPVGGWITAVFLHFLHNASVSSGSLLCILAFISDWGGVWLTVAIIIWALVQERNWIKHYLVEEVELGIITPKQHKIASSSTDRISHNLQTLFSQGPSAYLNIIRFYQKCSELAYKKHHYSLFKDAKSNELIEKLRQELTTLGPTVY